MSTEDIIGWIATGLSAIVYAAPSGKLLNVFKGRFNYEDLPTGLIGTTYINCFVWYFYGKLILSKQLKVCNLIGCGLSLFFTIIYLACEISKFLTDTILNALIIASGTWTAYRTFSIILTDNHIVDKICIGTTLIALICPLYLIYRVVNEKNYRLIPNVTVVFSILSGILWSVYGFMRNNYYIICLNLLVVFVGITEIVVSQIYKTKYPTIEQVREISTIGIESSGDDDNAKKIGSVDVKVSEESAEEGEKIKAKPVKIVAKKESKETPV